MQEVNDDDNLHILWREVQCLDGRKFYFNPFSGQINWKRFSQPPQVPGGILADEMVPILCDQHRITVSWPSYTGIESLHSSSQALNSKHKEDALSGLCIMLAGGCPHTVWHVQGMGKTVELLACIIAHPFPGPRVPPSLVCCMFTYLRAMLGIGFHGCSPVESELSLKRHAKCLLLCIGCGHAGA
jgi:hypothetical protein